MGLSRLAKILALFLVIFTLVACKNTKSPTTPTEPEVTYPKVSINPKIIHMKLGETKEFTAQGGDGKYDFLLSDAAKCKFNMETTAPNTVRLTWVTDNCNSHITSVELRVSSTYNRSVPQGYLEDTATIYLDK